VRQGLTPKPRLAPHLCEPIAIDDVEGEPEFRGQLVLPLQQHGRRRGHQNEVDAAAEQKLAHDEPRLDCLAQPDVIGDQQIHARQSQRLAQRKKLVGVEPDAGSERRLKQVAFGSGGALPFQRTQVCRKDRRAVGPVLADRAPGIGIDLCRPYLGIQNDLGGLALRIIRDAGKMNDVRFLGSIDVLHEPFAAA
jgi:hypothetical protein